ncbi:MAG: hypothetical protein BWY91_02678 [bacterium ADurb.BinA028]|nr:MAG: hypothetical protein BWY91_02678 [bacterium ADurb.BinA028]
MKVPARSVGEECDVAGVLGGAVSAPADVPGQPRPPEGDEDGEEHAAGEVSGPERERHPRDGDEGQAPRDVDDAHFAHATGKVCRADHERRDRQGRGKGDNREVPGREAGHWPVFPRRSTAAIRAPGTVMARR